jgi:hypothetical protein
VVILKASKILGVERFAKSLVYKRFQTETEKIGKHGFPNQRFTKSWAYKAYGLHNPWFAKSIVYTIMGLLNQWFTKHCFRIILELNKCCVER